MSIVNERGNTVLHDAARWSSVQLVRLLLKNKAPLTVRNLHGLTPLQMAKVKMFLFLYYIDQIILYDFIVTSKLLHDYLIIKT